MKNLNVKYQYIHLFFLVTASCTCALRANRRANIGDGKNYFTEMSFNARCQRERAV